MPLSCCELALPLLLLWSRFDLHIDIYNQIRWVVQGCCQILILLLNKWYPKNDQFYIEAPLEIFCWQQQLLDCNFLNRLLRPNGIWQKRPPFLIITFTILAFFRGLDLVLVKRDMWHVDKSVRLRCHTHNILTIRWKSPISGTIKTTKTRALKTYTISHPHSWVLDFCHLNYGPVR